MACYVANNYYGIDLSRIMDLCNSNHGYEYGPRRIRKSSTCKGLPENTVMWSHILRVAAPPILTGLILSLTSSIGGAILTETVFNWPGMGRLYYDAILAVDESVMVALTFIFTLIYILARFTLEILYLIVDPRVRY